MELYYSFSILIVLASIFSYINHRFLKLPSTIGIMLIGILVSIFMVFWGENILPRSFNLIMDTVNKFDFTELLMGFMLNFLLFAGGIHINIKDLKQQFGPVLVFSTVGVVISTFVVGILIYYIFPYIGLNIPFIFCLLFGALISPTDPVAVLSVLKQANVTKSLETKVAGESLFNDGIAVVLFSVILQLAMGENVELTFKHISLLLLKEAGGGLLLGMILGFTASRAMRKVDDYIVSVLITLAVVMGGYLIAHTLHFSSPLTMVAAGLFMGNFNVRFKMKSVTQDYLIKFWELIDEVLNAILFLFMGLVLVTISKDINAYWIAGVICIAVVLLARFISIWGPTQVMPFKSRFSSQSVKILVWGGIRGGVSIALALSIPKGEYSNFIVSITYVVVVFSILVQGLTVGKIAQSTTQLE